MKSFYIQRLSLRKLEEKLRSECGVGRPDDRCLTSVSKAPVPVPFLFSSLSFLS